MDNKREHKSRNRSLTVKAAVFLVLAIVVIWGMFFRGNGQKGKGVFDPSVSSVIDNVSVTEDGEYTDRAHVALYIHTFGKLPANYITKTKARKEGWDPDKGDLWDKLPGKSIGGGDFFNSEGLLPEKNGRRYYECDIDYNGGSRGEKRIVFSNDGLIYYTGDHYRSFELLYGDI